MHNTDASLNKLSKLCSIIISERKSSTYPQLRKVKKYDNSLNPKIEKSKITEAKKVVDEFLKFSMSSEN
jgi:hypothetical protein